VGASDGAGSAEGTRDGIAVRPTEVVELAAYVEARFPQQKFNEYTADVWNDDLAEYRLVDAKTAASRWAKAGHSFLSVGELVTEIRALRDERIGRWPEPAPPASIADSPKLCIQFSKDWRRRAGDGEFERMTEEQYQRQVMGQAVHELTAAQSRKSITGVIEATQQRMRAAVERKAAEQAQAMQRMKDASDEIVRRFEEQYYGDELDCPDCGDRYVQADVYTTGEPNESDWSETVQRRCPEGHVWVIRKTNEID
jgi:hypothetical protein